MGGLSGLGSFFGGRGDKNPSGNVVSAESVGRDAEKLAATASRRQVLSSDPLINEFLSYAKVDQNTWINNTDRDLMSEFDRWKTGVKAPADAANNQYLEVKTALLNQPGRKANILADPVQKIGNLLGKSVL